MNSQFSMNDELPFTLRFRVGGSKEYTLEFYRLELQGAPNSDEPDTDWLRAFKVKPGEALRTLRRAYRDKSTVSLALTDCDTGETYLTPARVEGVAYAGAQVLLEVHDPEFRIWGHDYE